MVRVYIERKHRIKIDTDDYEYLKDLKKYFTFKVDNYQFMPAFRSGLWNGTMCLFAAETQTLAYGLLIDFMKFHKKHHPKIKLNIDNKVLQLFQGDKDIKIKYDLKIQPWDFQDVCIREALKKSKGIVRVATGGGKSSIITYIIKILLDNEKIDNAIIIVPTQSLVEQFYDDMINEYGVKRSLVGRVYQKYKDWNSKIVISTWQTLSKNEDMINKYECIIVDETHQSKAVQLGKILRKSNARYRYGFTGTLHSSELDNLNVKSYIGPVICDYPASQLAEWGYLSKCNVNVINIDYKEDYEGAFDDVKDAIFNNEYRLNLISAIARNVNSNLLVLVGKVEKEGKVLKEFLSESNPDKEIVFLSGRDKTDIREHWRKECGKRKDIVLICTYGIFQQGINIPTLKHMLMAAPFKSKIRVLQSIGRTLRRHANKTDGAQVFDIIDNVKYFDRQGDIRLRYYVSEAFKIHETGTKEI